MNVTMMIAGNAVAIMSITYSKATAGLQDGVTARRQDGAIVGCLRVKLRSTVAKPTFTRVTPTTIIKTMQAA
jgi:hypothetical protein